MIFKSDWECIVSLFSNEHIDIGRVQADDRFYIVKTSKTPRGHAQIKNEFHILKTLESTVLCNPIELQKSLEKKVLIYNDTQFLSEVHPKQFLNIGLFLHFGFQLSKILMELSELNISHGPLKFLNLVKKGPRDIQILDFDGSFFSPLTTTDKEERSKMNLDSLQTIFRTLLTQKEDNNGQLPKIQNNFNSPEIVDFIASTFCLGDQFESVDSLHAKFASIIQLSQQLKVTTQCIVLKESKLSLDQITQQKISSIAHEFNTPLGICQSSISHILGEVNSLESHIKTGNLKKTELKEFLMASHQAIELASINIQRASQLAEKLRFAKQDEYDYQLETLDTSPYFEKFFQGIRTQLPSFVNIEYATTGKSQIKTYPLELSQILTNLINNSIHHAFEEGKQGHILVNINITDTKISITVSDDGKGIDSKNLPKIFTTYHSTGKDQGRTGLGLSLIKEIIENAFLGSIICSSELGKGTEFQIELLHHK